MRVRCTETVEEITFKLKRHILKFEKGKEYICVDMGTSTVLFVIGEDGYKQSFTLSEFLSTFKEIK